jgi:hypothetical protein
MGWETSWSTEQNNIQDSQWNNPRSNKVPTHDPYTNPNAYIYFECSCGEVLDPGTKSFTTLIKNASEADWKIRFGQDHYQAYCAKCGVDIE